jgi:hypothetical protein
MVATSNIRVLPAYKKDRSARASRLATDEGYHLPPRADLNPRRLSSAAIDRSVIAPSARMVSMMGERSSAKRSTAWLSAALPVEPARLRLRGFPRMAPEALLATSAARVRSEIRRRSFSARAAYTPSRRKRFSVRLIRPLRSAPAFGRNTLLGTRRLILGAYYSKVKL